MYNGSQNDNDSGTRNGYNNYTPGGTATRRIGGRNFQIKPIYVYIAVGVVAILAIGLVMRFLDTNLTLHFGAAAGALLLIANLRELLNRSTTRQNSSSLALSNSLIGGALLCAWLTWMLGWLMWLPAIVLLALAAPVAVSRASFYRTYIDSARDMFNNVSRVTNRRN